MADALPTIWFIAIALLWTGYLLLEGFDLGVGMHMLITGRSTTQRRVMLNTIGPVWDGNEVWLVTAVAGTLAAFPAWYASLLSSMYLPVTVLLLALITRAVGIEYRGKGVTKRWERFWETAIGVGSFVAALAIGALLAVTTTGLPLDSNGDRVGGAFAWLSGPAILGGIAVVGFCLVHAAVFLSLKTDGSVRVSAARFSTRFAPLALLPMVGWMLVVLVERGNAVTWSVAVVALVAGASGWRSARMRREGYAFVGIAAFLVLSAGAIFGSLYPAVLPSTLDPSWDLTIHNAANAPYTLGVMTVVALVGLPLVLAYQAWSYWVFRKRISERQLPDEHAVLPAIRPATQAKVAPEARR